jgi:superfamily I DNA/RNA helicase
LGKAVRVDADKVRQLIDSHLLEEDIRRYSTPLKRLIGFAKANAMPLLLADTSENWAQLAETIGLELEDEEATPQRLYELASKILRANNAITNKVDFDDMLTFPLLLSTPLQKFDWVFVDEAQDLSPVQHALLKRMTTTHSRVVAVGDSHQAIYAFRGAMNDSMDRLKEAFHAVSLPLSISYRCATRIVEEAQVYVPQIEASPTAPEGEVRTLDKWSTESFFSEDGIICRNVKPLVALAYKLIAARVPCRILGRDIGQGLLALVRKWKSARSIGEFRAKLDRWYRQEADKAERAKQDAKLQSIEDRYETLCLISEHLGDEEPLSTLITEIEGLFTDNGVGKLTLCTVHKSKGLEFPRCFLLDSDKLMPSKFAKTDSAKQQELNLIYVAITRAKETLFRLSSDVLK